MARLIYSDEHIDYVREIAKGRWNDDIRDMFNVKFNMSVTKVAISSIKSRHNIISNVGTAKPQYTEEQNNYIREIGETRSNEEVRDMFNEKFKQDRTNRAIRCLKNKLGVTTDYRFEWEKGAIPWNKGLKGYMGPNKTSFKKGDFSPNRVPLGSERITKDNYIQIKTRDGELQGNWRGKHIIIWEKVNGPLPEGHAIIFGDKDNRNFDIDNLILVSRKQLLGLNRHDLIQDDAELTKVAVNIVDMKYRINELERDNESNVFSTQR